MNSANYMKCKMYLFVAILEMDLIAVEMSHAKFGDCITICTIRPKNAYYLLHCKCYNLSQGKCYNMPQRPLAHEMCDCGKIRCTLGIHLASYRVRYTGNHDYVNIHNIIFNYRSKKATCL